MSDSVPTVTGRPKIFICYAKADVVKARDVSHFLARAGADPWLDEEQLLLGDQWRDEEIPEALINADAMVVCLSPAFLRGPGFRWEELRLGLEAARQRPIGQKFLYVFIVEPCGIPSWVKKEGIHIGDATRPSTCEELLKALKERFSGLVPSPPGTRPTPPPPRGRPLSAELFDRFDSLAEQLAKRWPDQDQDELAGLIDSMAKLIPDMIHALEDEFRKRTPAVQRGELASTREELQWLTWRLNLLLSPRRDPQLVECLIAWPEVLRKKKTLDKLKTIEGFLDKSGRGWDNPLAHLAGRLAEELGERYERECKRLGVVLGVTLGPIIGLAIGWVARFTSGATWYCTVPLYVVAGVLVGLPVRHPFVGAGGGLILGAVVQVLAIDAWPARILGWVGGLFAFGASAPLIGGVVLGAILGALVGSERGAAHARRVLNSVGSAVRTIRMRQ